MKHLFLQLLLFCTALTAVAQQCQFHLEERILPNGLHQYIARVDNPDTTHTYLWRINHLGYGFDSIADFPWTDSVYVLPITEQTFQKYSFDRNFKLNLKVKWPIGAGLFDSCNNTQFVVLPDLLSIIPSFGPMVRYGSGSGYDSLVTDIRFSRITADSLLYIKWNPLIRADKTQPYPYLLQQDFWVDSFRVVSGVKVVTRYHFAYSQPYDGSVYLKGSNVLNQLLDTLPRLRIRETEAGVTAYKITVSDYLGIKLTHDLPLPYGFRVGATFNTNLGVIKDTFRFTQDIREFNEDSTMNYVNYVSKWKYMYSSNPFHWIMPDGSRIDNQQTVTFIPDSVGQYNIRLVANDSSGFKDSMTYTIYVRAKHNYFVHSWIDTGSVCVYDTLDYSLAGILYKITPGPYYVTTDVNGTFKLPLSPGTYELHNLNEAKAPFRPCFTSGFTINSSDDSVFQAVPHLNSNATDLAANHLGGKNARARMREWTFRYYSVRNEGLVSSNARITLEWDHTVLDSMEIVPGYEADSIYTASAVWYRTLKPGENFIIQTMIVAPLYTNVDDIKPIRFVMKVDSVNGEQELDNNTDTTYAIPGGAIDPNEKHCNQEGYVLPDIAYDLEYVLHFQNCGNDYARNIVLVDTLDARLNLEGIKMMGASHNNRVVIEDRVMKIFFDDIYLPDSGFNEPASHGVILFRIPMNNPLALGERIQNTAYIYFDYQPAVVTNTTWFQGANLETVREKNEMLSEQMFIYPNPNNGLFTVVSNNKSPQELCLMDVSGKQIGTYLMKDGRLELQLLELESGLYFLRSTSTQEVHKISIIR